jgi:hypothetical protein
MRRLFRTEALAQIARHDPWSVSRAEWREPSGDWLAAAQYDDLNRYLPLDILTKVDRMTMAHSIEARPPLLDHKFVEFAATIPARFRLQGRDTKYIFKKAMRGILPDSIIDRQKHGFVVPLARWFRGDLEGFARDVLLSGTCRERGIFDTRSVEHLFQLHSRGRDLDLQLWTMLSFELWCRRFLDTTDVRDVAPEHEADALQTGCAGDRSRGSTGSVLPTIEPNLNTTKKRARKSELFSLRPVANTNTATYSGTDVDRPHLYITGEMRPVAATTGGRVRLGTISELARSHRVPSSPPMARVTIPKD